MMRALIHLLRATEHARYASPRTRRLLLEATARLTTRMLLARVAL